MRARVPTQPQRAAEIIWSEEDDATFTRTRAALSDALDELDLPADTPEDTVKILRLPDAF